MAVWLVRAGKSGEREQFALEKNIAVIGWDEMPDLSKFTAKDEMASYLQNALPQHTTNSISNHTGQLWAFAKRIEVGDLIVLPLKTSGTVALGKCVGPYEYQSEFPDGAKHTRKVEWTLKDIPRSRFDQDLLYSFGAFMTVCQIKRNNAEERISAIIAGKEGKTTSVIREESQEPNDLSAPPDLETYSLTQIQDFISRNFVGHKLAYLVAEILKSQGYQVEVSPPGADGGVDIIGGKGVMGFDEPRLCVQVKSGSQQVDAKELRELKGVMQDVGATHGLLVSWGGFKRTVANDTRRNYFEIRLWDADGLVKMIFEHYDKFSEEMKADLPFKRIWTLVQEE